MIAENGSGQAEQVLEELLSALDRHSSTPMYDQVASVLRQWSAQVAPGTRLPTEQHLTAELKISRTTVRRALDALVDDGLLVRRQGKGTFTAPQRVTLNRIQTIPSMFHEAGIDVVHRVLEYTWVSASEDLPEDLPAGTGALRIVRQYTSPAGMMAIAVVHLPAVIGSVIARNDVESQTIYTLLKERLGLEPVRAEVGVRAVHLPDELAEMVPDFPRLCIRLDRTTHGPEGDVLEHTDLYMELEAFEFRANVDAESATQFDPVMGLGAGRM